MGLFHRKKTQQPDPSARAGESEFDSDVRKLLARDDIHGPADICRVEYQKAQDLLKNHTEETLHRAYDLMGHLASVFEYLPAMMWMGDFCEGALEKNDQAAFWYRKAAEKGDGQGARCYADMLMAGKGVEQNMELAYEYYAKAANRGVPEAAFVMGEYFRTNGRNDFAEQAYQQAYRGGYKPAAIRLEQLKNQR